MRIHFDSVARPKLVAKALRRELNAVGRPQSLSRCQEATAVMFGYTDWHDLDRNHAIAPASADDAVSPSLEVSARRARYGAVLRERFGLSIEEVATVLDKVRPTARNGALGSTTANAFPRLLIEAFETDLEGNKIRSLGIQDLTHAVVMNMAFQGNRTVRELPFPPYLHDIRSGLSKEAAALGYERKLYLADFKRKLKKFISAVGGLIVFPDFRARLGCLDRYRRLIENAETELRKVRKANFEPDAKKFEWYYAPLHSEEEFLHNHDDAYSDWNWDEYEHANPRPDWRDEAAQQKWWAGRSAYIRDHAPSFVFGTKPDKWTGLSPKWLRDHYEEIVGTGEDRISDEEMAKLDVEGSVWQLVESSLEEHYEDATDQIVDDGDLMRIVKAWWPHAGTGSPEDLALEGELKVWNAAQTIVSYMPDESVLVPVFEGATKENAVQWCENRLATLKAEQEALLAWVPPEDPEPIRLIKIVDKKPKGKALTTPAPSPSR